MYYSIGEVRINYFQCDFFTRKVTPAPYLAREEPSFQYKLMHVENLTVYSLFVNSVSEVYYVIKTKLGKHNRGKTNISKPKQFSKLKLQESFERSLDAGHHLLPLYPSQVHLKLTRTT